MEYILLSDKNLLANQLIEGLYVALLHRGVLSVEDITDAGETLVHTADTDEEEIIAEMTLAEMLNILERAAR
ncbi:hypothetical protein [Sphingomonas gilva]|nr:hypothetical protein [Sphingomonas gilva]